MKTKNKPGALPKFGSIKTKLLRITRVVPLDDHDKIKELTNDFIKKLESESLERCANECVVNR